MSSLTKIPAGVQYFFDEEVKLRRYVELRAMEVFAGWSYDEIILPMFDYHDLFARGMGQEKAERTYRFVDRDGALLALRPELTSLVARTVATRFIKRERPVRLCYSGEVFRYDDPAERAARVLHPDDSTRASALWKHLIELAIASAAQSPSAEDDALKTRDHNVLAAAMIPEATAASPAYKCTSHGCPPPDSTKSAHEVAMRSLDRR